MQVLISAFACAPGRGSEPGVGWNWAYTLAAISDHRVTVLTQEQNRAAIERQLIQEGQAGIAFRYVSLFGDGRIPFGTLGHYVYYYLWQLKALLTLAKSGEWRNFDLIHHLTYGGIRAGSFLWLLPRPFMFGPIGGGEHAPLRLVRPLGRGALIKELLRALSNRFSRIDPNLIAMQIRATRALARTTETAQLLPFAAHRLSVQNEVAANEANIGSRDHRAKDNSPLKLLFAGRLLYWKGPYYLMKAVKLLDDDGIQCHLDVAGEGECAELIANDAQTLTNCTVSMHGRLPQDDLFRLYREAHLFVFPSLHDSGATVVIEALTFGLPVVCFNLGGPPLITGKASITIDVSDASPDKACALLAEAIRRLRDDPQHRDELSRAAIARARELTWANTVRTGYGPLLFEASSELGESD